MCVVSFVSAGCNDFPLDQGFVWLPFLYGDALLVHARPIHGGVALNTAMLLFSSITYGFAMLAMEKDKVGATQAWLAITGLFGLAFLSIELYEFAHLIHEGATPQRSGFLSAFFALVGTHGLHVTFGIIWLVTLMVQVGQKGLIAANQRRLMCLSMFWHFLDVIWIGEAGIK